MFNAEEWDLIVAALNWANLHQYELQQSLIENGHLDTAKNINKLDGLRIRATEQYHVALEE